VIWNIISKELMENLLSFRFVLSLLLSISLFAVSGFVFVDNYRQQSQDYWQETNKNLSALSKQAEQLYELIFYQQTVLRKPQPLSLCAEGFEKTLPNCFKFNVFTADLPKVKGRSIFMLPHFSEIDWTFIISFIFSFVALIFTYNSICGEKQAGTLRLMLAGAIPRHKILLGKYLGVMFTLGIPLLIGILVSLIIVLSSNIATISGMDWLKIFIISFLSILYLSSFALLGMFISSRTASSANSIVILLLIWVGLVILLPKLGRITSEIYYKVPSITELYTKVNEHAEQFFHEARAGNFGKNVFQSFDDRNHPSNNPPAAARFWNTLFTSESRIYEQHHNKMLRQAFASRNFVSISPVVIYQRASESIAGTGIKRCANLHKQIKRYQSELKEFVLAEDQKDPDSLHLLFPFRRSVKNWQAISHKSVDFDTVPKFQERDLRLGESLQLAIWDIGLLALFNLVFFVAAFVSFLRYDVR
jgi:ABC-type transport system involved in multi-copper enzyme maturation permease subunit